MVRLVEARLRLYDAIAPAARAARIGAWRHPVLAEQIASTRSYLRHQLERLFARELDALGPHRAPAALAAVDALCSFEAAELLHDGEGPPADALVHAVGRLLAP